MEKTLTNDQLISMSQHLCYEIEMLEETARLWGKSFSDIEDDNKILNFALLESFTINARVISDFLFPLEFPPKGRYADDIVALHYLSGTTLQDWVKYLNENGYSPIAKTDIDKRTAHFTTLRLEEKDWYFEPMRTPLLGAMRLFVDKADEGTLHQDLIDWRNQEETPYSGREYGFSHPD